MRELPMQFDRYRDTWVKTPSGSIKVTPQAGYRYYVRPKNQRAEFVSGFDAVEYVRGVAAHMGGVVDWNLGESLSEGEVTDASGPLPEGTAKNFFRSLNPPDIQWTGEVRVTRSASGRAHRWAWSATSPPLTLILDDEGGGMYYASFYRPGDHAPRILANNGFVSWPALTITHAENLAKDLLAHALFHPKESRAQVLVACLLESPKFSTLKKHKVKLTPEEREQAMKAGAVWHHGPGDEASCAIWKSVVNGKTWYGCNTHRAGQVKTTLKGAIRAFDFVKTTA